MREALQTLREIALDEVTGSVYWWLHGEGNKRALTRCSQGQGAWAWQYLYQWLGLQTDALDHTLIIAPRGLLNSYHWDDLRAGPQRLKLSGARWSQDGARKLAKARAAFLCDKVNFAHCARPFVA